MAQVISVNVGKPKEIAWRDQSVRTAIWKAPVEGKVMARRVNLDGDGQADLIGHGGANRAMLVYQIESYQYWERYFKEGPYEYGRFGENLTVTGMADEEVCVGDVYRIGGALVQVTQPRVTCYRLGIRMNHPEMPSLVVSHHRPGFYLKVIEEGLVGAGDEISLVERDARQMTVSEIDALLYLGDHPTERLERALSIEALSPGWKQSFTELHDAAMKGTLNGNPGLSQQSQPQAWQGFRRLKVVSTHDESADVRSFLLGGMDGHPLPRFEAGQYVVLKFGSDGAKTFVRCYSLSGGVDTSNWRISVKRENHGQASSWLHEHLMAGNAIDVSAPRGNFLIEESEDPVVFLSAGIGITPLFSMLHSLTANDKAPQRKVYWMRAARDSHHDVFKDEVRTTLRSLPNAISHVAYSQPLPEDQQNVDFDLEGHLSVAVMESLGVPKQSEFYLCGPTAFLKDFHRELQQWGTFESRIHFESFGSNAITSGSVKRTAVASSLTADRPMITLSKSSVSLVWPSDCNNILELLESNKIPVQWSCRVGVCHACENTILDGSVTYSPQPLDPPGEGRVLLCCSQPSSDVVLDI